MKSKAKLFLAGLLAALFVCGCGTLSRTGQLEPRRGDEIVAAGQFFHTGTRVVLWLDPGGYDAYRVERRFAPIEKSDWSNSCAEVKSLKTPNRYGLRQKILTPNEVERVRGGGWDLPLLQGVVDQFVIHFDEAGTSRTCFLVLQDDRDLSVHFMLDLDGTIYQTLDLKERAWQATTSNDRSVGVEVANVGAYRAVRAVVSDQRRRPDGHHTSRKVWRRRHPHDKFHRPSGTAEAGARHHPGRRPGAIRLHARTIRRADEADGGALQNFSKAAMPLPGGCGGKIDPA